MSRTLQRAQTLAKFEESKILNLSRRQGLSRGLWDRSLQRLLDLLGTTKKAKAKCTSHFRFSAIRYFKETF